MTDRTKNLLNEYNELHEAMDRLESVIALFDWDLRARAPKGSADNKLKVIGHYSSELFALRTGEEYGELLSQMAKPSVYEELTPAMKLTVDRERKNFRREHAVPAEFQKEFTYVRNKCERVWEEARQKNDFALFAPWLEKNIEMTKQYAAYLEPEWKVYDTLLDRNQPGVSCEETARLFEELREGLVPILKELMKRESGESALSFGRCDSLKASPEVNKAVQDVLLRYIGFDMNRGTTGDSVHALTGMIDSDDVRITNNYSRNPVSVMFSAIHEGGHGLYNQSVDPSYRGTAVNVLNSADIHESQSRFIENILGRNIHFWTPVWDELCGLIPELKDVSKEEFSEYINRIKPGPVRIEADDLTYCLHIILRFELEQKFFSEKVSAEELRELWNKKTEELLGVSVPDDMHGIMQDIHWSSIYFGYFPSYLLGSIYDGMLLEALERDLGDVDRMLEEGRISEIIGWLRENVYSHGSLYNGPELMEKVCGKKLTAEPLIRYFRRKKGL